MFSETDIRLKLFCPGCKNEKFGVCVSFAGELVVLCDECKSVVATFDKWPEEEPPECHNCKDGKCSDHSKLN